MSNNFLHVNSIELGFLGKNSKTKVSPAKLNYLLANTPNSNIRKFVYETLSRSASTISDQSIAILSELMEKRHQLANLMGHSSYSSKKLQRELVQSPENVLKFLADLHISVKAKAEQELETIKERKKKEEGTDQFDNWDVDYYKKKCMADYNTKSNLEFFSLGSCMKGLNIITSSLFGVCLQVVPHHPSEVWHPSVQKLRLWHETEGLVGYIYLDLFPREKKHTEAAHFIVDLSHSLETELLSEQHEYVTHMGEKYRVPKVALVCQLKNRAEDNKDIVLLEHQEVQTLFHEFGHCLHTMFARTKFQDVSGTRTTTDFVEMPSTFMEYFASNPHVLKQFAHHYKYNYPIPDDLTLPLLEKQAQFSGTSAELQIFFAHLDQTIHGENPPKKDELSDSIKQLQESILTFPDPIARNNYAHISDNSYAASYYSYLYAKVFSSNIWYKYFNADPLNRETGEKFRREVLQWGGSKDGNSIMKHYLKETPNINFYTAHLYNT
eukprot:CAMPEP_0174274406 /NCGR_PEP_ID=MMETSP0439-20130205/57892_1 /TAXON_ID=0 /ORGANISM="Stereomyxa ramosa, Strain Chinc5" /LENGTH=494 /DNA_ID=CAMNT_0015366153 /DNA_START=665 /DNA_END=2145 /DNA_ORIENTATION=+